MPSRPKPIVTRKTNRPPRNVTDLAKAIFVQADKRAVTGEGPPAPRKRP